MATLTKEVVLSHASVFEADKVMEAWKTSSAGHLQLVGLDKKYRALPKDIWDEILDEHLTVRKYVPDFLDCDGFSSIFMGTVLSLYEVNGIARIFDFGAKHSYNAVLVTSETGGCEWHRVEPQADMFLMELKSSHPEMYASMEGFAVTA